MLLTEVTIVEVTIGEGNGSEGSTGVGNDDVLNLLELGIIDGLPHTVRIHVVGALLKDVLGSTLAEKTLVVATVAGSIADNSGHALALGGELEANEIIVLVDALSLALGLHKLFEGLRRIFNGKASISDASTLEQIGHTLIGGTD